MTDSHSTISAPAPRKTYPQDWSAYNAAQTNEKDTLMMLLADLGQSVEQPLYRFGRPGLPIADMIYVAALKVYVGFSARRFDSDVRAAHSQGFTSVAPSFTSVNRYIAKEALTPVLKDLIARSAAPLSVLETEFALDSSGFATSRYERWFDHKWGKEKSQRQWTKAHIATGVLTNVVTSVEVTGGTAHDSPLLPELLENTAKYFDIREVSADKAYLSETNFREIERYGAEPYIPFKSNTTGKGSPMWRRLYAYYVMNEDSWKVHYHKRSNVETTFSMIKGKFGADVRSKTDTGQINEVLLKVLCHNLCVLIQSMYEYGVTPNLEPIVLPQPKGLWLN